MWFAQNSYFFHFFSGIDPGYHGEIGQRYVCLIIKAYVNHGWDPETPSNATNSSSPPKLTPGTTMRYCVLCGIPITRLPNEPWLQEFRAGE